MTLHGRTLVTAMCLAQVCNLLPHVVVPAIMAQDLMPLWHLSAAQAGVMASAYALGYMLLVPVLTALTDRVDARGILLAGSVVSGLGTISFGLFADGLVSASLFWALAGAGFGGAIVALCWRSQAEAAAHQLKHAYHAETGFNSDVFICGIGDGARPTSC